MKDYFISYNSEDEAWAKWIASVLEENNHTVIIQAWDFRPGANFVLEMHNAALNTRRTLIVLSDNYLKAEYTHPEWATAFSEDPQGNDRKLVPVRVEECKPNGLLRPIVYINVFNLEETVAEMTLLEGLKRDIRPQTRTRFPGGEKIGEKKCLQNLIHRDFETLIGRKKELKKLLECISPNYRKYITEVDGIGGLGKTALVLEAAHICKEAKEGSSKFLNQEIPVFDAIIYISAKTSSLESTGICYRSPEVQDKCLQDIFHVIATTLNSPIITQATAKNQLSQVYKCLSNQRTLLIIDNMETLEPSEKKKIYSFLNDLPSTTQAIITTRERLGFSSINLKELSRTSSLKLIKQEANALSVKISKENIEKIYERFKGIPLALKYTVGKIALRLEIDFNTPIDEHIALFCFEESVKHLRGHYSHKLLMALALFQGAPTKEYLIEVAGLSSKNYITVDEELNKLKILNLVDENGGCYYMLTMTKEYTKLEINQDNDFEDAARERLIKLYLKFTKEYGGLDWEQWLV
ncbi:MAG: toll/interleukin-1 receptor domain-containing protein, partial [Cyanobacteria bacterium J06621_12]